MPETEPEPDSTPVPVPPIPADPLAQASPRFTPSLVPVQPEPPSSVPELTPEPTPTPQTVTAAAPQTQPSEPATASAAPEQQNPAASASPILAGAHSDGIRTGEQSAAPSGEPGPSSATGGLAAASPTGRDPNGQGGGSTGDGGTALTGRPGSPAGVRGFKPVYPNLSRKRGEQGLVKVEVDVRADGTVAATRILTDAGYPRLAQAAVDAIRKAEFIPARQDGHPVDDRVIVPFEFTLHGR
jgi:protein TonB